MQDKKELEQAFEEFQNQQFEAEDSYRESQQNTVKKMMAIVVFLVFTIFSMLMTMMMIHLRPLQLLFKMSQTILGMQMMAVIMILMVTFLGERLPAHC